MSAHRMRLINTPKVLQIDRFSCLVTPEVHPVLKDAAVVFAHEFDVLGTHCIVYHHTVVTKFPVKVVDLEL